MMKDLIATIQQEFYERFSKQVQRLVPRDYEFPNLDNKIKVAIGMRRSGKTYFLLQIISNLLKSGIEKEQILYINFEDDRLLPCNQKKLAALLDAFYGLYPENHDRK